MTHAGSHPADGFARLDIASVRICRSQVRVRYMCRVVNRDSEGETEIDSHQKVEGKTPVMNPTQSE